MDICASGLPYLTLPFKGGFPQRHRVFYENPADVVQLQAFNCDTESHRLSCNQSMQVGVLWPAVLGNCPVNHESVFGSSGMSTNALSHFSHVLIHVFSYFGFNAAWYELQCCGETDYWIGLHPLRDPLDQGCVSVCIWWPTAFTLSFIFLLLIWDPQETFTFISYWWWGRNENGDKEINGSNVNCGE